MAAESSGRYCFTRPLDGQTGQRRDTILNPSLLARTIV
jgi:hypothetical protein